VTTVNHLNENSEMLSGDFLNEGHESADCEMVRSLYSAVY